MHLVVLDAEGKEKVDIHHVPQFYGRQGGSATDWNTQGTTDYTPTAVRMQAGTIRVTVLDTYSSGQTAVTFPVAFSAKPVVVATSQESDNGGTPYPISIAAATVTIAILLDSAASGNLTFDVCWIAIGPE